MTHGTLTESSLSPHDRKGREGNREGNGSVGPKAPSIVTAVDATHVHLFVPQPSGRLYGKVRWRNTCACGTRQHPDAPTMDGAPRPILRGPACWRCGFPTAAGTVDLEYPLHPCCAEPALMALGRAHNPRRRKARR